MISPISGKAAENDVANLQELAKSYGSWQGIRTNHIITQQGQFAGEDGSSRSISNSQDLELLLELRRHSEVLVVDAATARAERYRAPANNLLLVLVSATSNFEGVLAFEAKAKNVFLASPKEAGPNWIGTDSNPWIAIHSFATSLSKQRILAESGPKLSRLAFGSGLVSQSALTITPTLNDFSGVNRFHPFDEDARALSVAQGKWSTFTLWSH